MNEKTIDIVITWVDGSDEVWQKRKSEFSKKNSDKRDERFRDTGSLKYLLRGIDLYAPWVRKVHLVTEGHLPKWLNTKCEKLHIVKHEDFMPAETLPTFPEQPLYPLKEAPAQGQTHSWRLWLHAYPQHGSTHFHPYGCAS